MGYRGLKWWFESDAAAEVMSDVKLAVFDALNRGLHKTRGDNGFNTPGAVNVALVLESNILNAFGYLNPTWKPLLKTVKKDLEKLIAETKNRKLWTDKGDRYYHQRAYERMLRSLNQALARIN